MKYTSNKITLLTILICAYCNAQTSDFIVTASRDTIYVDKINLSDTEVKTKSGDKKTKYSIGEIISFYDFSENSYFERVKNPAIEKINAKKNDRYDYRQQEKQHIDDYEKTIPYKFFRRLTNGKVKLFTNGSVYNLLNPSPSPSTPLSYSYNNKSYYISIHDSKLELLKENDYLKLTKDVYEILKVYLYGNDEIARRLDKLLLSKPIAKEQQIIDLINEYNIWVDLKK